jgi:DNA-binding MarR family transcriptional regulator
MGVTTANMPWLVDKLESDGLVRRRKSKEDRREIFIEATPKGSQTFDRLKSVAEDELRRVFDGWTDKDLRILIRYLNRLSGENLDELTNPLQVLR